jgi:hypothetical protein
MALLVSDEPVVVVVVVVVVVAAVVAFVRRRAFAKLASRESVEFSILFFYREIQTFVVSRYELAFAQIRENAIAVVHLRMTGRTLGTHGPVTFGR